MNMPIVEKDSRQFLGKSAGQRHYKSKPAEAESIANMYLNDGQAPDLYRIEANNLMGMLRFRQP